MVTKTITRKSQASYSPDEKKKLCESWYKSNLSKNKFRRQHGLPSSFHNWCNTLLPKGMPDNPSTDQPVDQWLQVIPINKAKDRLQQVRQQHEAIEFKLICNDIALNFCMPMEKIIIFIKELNHAAAVIR